MVLRVIQMVIIMILSIGVIIGVCACRTNTSLNELETELIVTEHIEKIMEEISDINELEIPILEQMQTNDQVSSSEKSQSVIEFISTAFNENDYKAALSFEENSLSSNNNHIVLLSEDSHNNITIYGFKTEKYGSRGIIVDVNGIKGLFDYVWNANRGVREIYVADFDDDGQNEVAFVFLGASGTGVSIERLVMFEISKEKNTIQSIEFTDIMQYEEISQSLRIVGDNGNIEIIYNYDDSVLKSIITGFSNEQIIGIDCLNQVRYFIEGAKIQMIIEIGIFADGVRSYYDYDAIIILIVNYIPDQNTFKLEIKN